MLRLWIPWSFHMALIIATSIDDTLAQYTCGRTFQLDLTKGPNNFKLNFKEVPGAQKCLWSIFGEGSCEVEVSCKYDIPQTVGCPNSYIKVSDGVAGEGVYCGKGEFTTRAGLGLRDLFVVLEKQDKDSRTEGISCDAKCLPPGGGVRLGGNIKRKFEPRCACGLQNRNDRIVNGEDAKANEFPWQAAIVYPGTRKPNCGATVINDRFVLCAAHCFWFEDKKPAEIEVLVKAHVLDMTELANAQDVALGEDGSTRSSGRNATHKTDEDEKSQRFKVAEIINHPDFTEFYDFDYALLRLDGRINLAAADAPTPICLPAATTRDSFSLEGKNLTVSGWGLAAENAGGTTRILQKLEVPYIDFDECRSWYRKLITQRMICAGFRDGVKDACTGDSGGPLVYKKENKRWFQFGIVSWGEGCARSKRPGVYSRVTEMLQWIHFHTYEQDAKWCQEES